VRYVLEGPCNSPAPKPESTPNSLTPPAVPPLGRAIDTPRADLLQRHDEIVIQSGAGDGVATYRGRGRPSQTDASSESRRRAFGPPRFCGRGERRIVGKEADAGYSLCEQALRVDLNNVRALGVLSMKFHVPVLMGMSADPEADLKRADELASQAPGLRSSQRRGS
jgi:hypothetical protein